MKNDRRQSILEAAAYCFSSFGYEKTSMADIGARVGMNKASLYYHFRDKLDLFAAMVEDKRKLHNADLDRILSDLVAGPERVLAFLRAEIGFVSRLSLNFFEPMGQQAGQHPTDAVFDTIIREDLARFMKLVAEWPDFAAKNSSIPNTEEAAARLAGSILKVVQGLLLSDCPFDRARDERPEAYRKVQDDAESIVSLMLKGAIA